MAKQRRREEVVVQMEAKGCGSWPSQHGSRAPDATDLTRAAAEQGRGGGGTTEKVVPRDEDSHKGSEEREKR